MLKQKVSELEDEVQRLTFSQKKMKEHYEKECT